MLPQEHFIYGFFFAALLLFILPLIGILGFMLIVLSAVLIDADHYLYYFYVEKGTSLTKAYAFFRKNKKKFLSLAKEKRAEYYGAWCIFHGIEMLILTLLCTFFISEIFGFIFIGISFHLILDYIEQWPFYLRKDKISSAYDFLKFKKLQNINEL